MRRAVVVALAVALTSSRALADEAEGAREPVELVYHVPPGCPSEADFIAVVTARTQRAKFVDEGASRRFVVTVRRKRNTYEGRLVIESVGSAVREYSGARCDDVVRALSLFTVIALTPAPNAVEAPKGPETPPPPRPPETRAAPPARPRPSPPPAPEPSRFRYGAWGSGVFAAGGVAQSLMVSAHPVVEIAEVGQLWSPSARVGLVWANSPAESAETAELALGLRMLVVTGCLLRLAVGDLGLRVCAAFEGGVLTIRPFGLLRPRSRDNPWFAIAPVLRAEVPILRRRLALELDVGVAAPFTRFRGYVNPGPVVTEVGTTGVRLGAAFVLHAF